MAWTAPSTWVSGAILTAAQMNVNVRDNTNALYDRDGLILITSVSPGSGLSSVPVNSAFSAEYSAYKIVISGITASTAPQGRITFGAATTGYYYSYNYTNYGGATNAAVSGSNAAFIDYAVAFEGSGAGNVIEVINPFKAMWTRVQAQYPGSANTGMTTGVLQNTTSYTSFTITPASGTVTGGKISVYGYAGS
jgi:hypothetical protein